MIYLKHWFSMIKNAPWHMSAVLGLEATQEEVREVFTAMWQFRMFEFHNPFSK